MPTTDDVTQLLRTPGAWTYAYLDGHGDQPQSSERSRRRAVVERLAEAGAPEADRDAVAEALASDDGIPSPSSRYLLVQDGEVALDERFAAPRVGDELVGHDAAPPILPLLRHRGDDVRYLVVEADREGADVRLERATHAEPDRHESVDGRDDSLTKVQTGGLSHARYQRAAEEVWKSNLGDVAEVVDRAVRDAQPAFVVVSGDVRARQVLGEQLAVASRELVIEVDANTRADGADAQALDAAIDAAVEEGRRLDVARLVDRAEADGGSAKAEGVTDVLAALQQAQAEAVLLDARLLDAPGSLDALGDAPWAVHEGTDALGAERIGTVSTAEGIARAAVLSGARVVVLDDEPAADDAPREVGPAREPVAVLRWTTG